MSLYRLLVSALRPGQGALSKMVGSSALPQIAQLKSGGLSLAQLQTILGEGMDAVQDQINSLNTLARQIQQFVEVDGSALPFTPPAGTVGQVQVNNGAGGFGTLTDITTDNVTSAKHGLAPKTPADAAQFLNGAATAAFAPVKDSDLSTSDITTNNASTAKHGFLKKLSNVATEYLNGQGNFSTPPDTPQTPWAQDIAAADFSVTGIKGISAKNLRTTLRTLTLSNGANDNVSPGDNSLQIVIGPSAGFSISGFSGGVDGKHLYIFNSTGQAMTITNAAGSSAGNQIVTPTGADVVIGAASKNFAWLVYDAADGFWLLLLHT